MKPLIRPAVASSMQRASKFQATTTANELNEIGSRDGSVGSLIEKAHTPLKVNTITKKNVNKRLFQQQSEIKAKNGEELRMIPIKL